MDKAAKQATPLVLSTHEAVAVPVGDFMRKTVFSPEFATSGNIKFCTVKGHSGAKSNPHHHPGDEIAYTLEGENTTRIQGRKYVCTTGRGLAIGPGVEHASEITGAATWKGCAFYCDSCPIIQKRVAGITNHAIRQSEGDKITLPSTLHKRTLFSPRLHATSFLELFLLTGRSLPAAVHFIHRGETVYYPVHGEFFLLWENEKHLLRQGDAAVVPAGIAHEISIRQGEECEILAGSCSSCSLYL